MKRWLLALSCVALLAACDEQQEPLAPIPAGVEKAEIAKGKPMLPAWRTEAEKLLGKGDEFSDYKDANPNTYGITNPPTVPFRPVAEWEPASIMLTTYTAGLSKNVAKTMAETVKYAADVVEVGVVVETAAAKTAFTTELKSVGMAQAKIDSKVTFYTMDNDSIWMRDYGPIPLVANGKVALTDLRYYPNRIYDDAIPTKLGNLWNVTVYRAPLDYEGGNLMTDTKGTCFASQGLLWFNPVSQAAVEKYMKEYVGCVKTYYTEPLDDGTTHIDMYSKLTDDKTWVMGKCTSTYCSAKTIATLDKNAAYLEQLGYKVHRIPMPSQKDGVWRTYTNSLFVNNSNLIPIFSVNKDIEAEAMNVWKTAMPTWNHIGILSDEVMSWGGAQHCTTMTIGVGAKSPVEAAPAFACNGAWDCWPGETPQTDSCAGKCGAQSGACYCDDACFEYGDCCDDVCEQCPNLGGCGECTPSCTGKVCGSDGCGGSCGTCPAGKSCKSGQCVDGGGGPVVDQCMGPNQASANDCQGLTYEGCCDSEGRLLFCDQNKLFCIDCGQNPTCGWNGEGKYYDCGTDGADDPSGTNPIDCGGGGPCTPSCAGKTCGSDGCGGSCGNCPAGKTCSNGACVDGPAGCGNVTYEGCCEGQTLKYCDQNQLKTIDCTQGPKCGWQPQGNFYDCGTDGKADPSGKNPMSCEGTCTPNCTGKTCGDNGCGGSCGTCSGGQACQTGQCVGCTPSCTGKVCGDDGCGGLCGSCPVGQTCQTGQCVGCQPNCAGKICGDDGCGGSCGTCPVGQTCKAGQCASGCTANCTGKLCGDDGCGGSCGTCAAGLECKNFQCTQPCVANCIGKPCGDDGCGGSCGTCAVGMECNASGQCVQPCMPNCVGKQCGDDGCGGLCGTCPAGLECQANMCVAPPTEDLGGEEDVIEPGNEDTGSGSGGTKKKSGGCSATGNSNHAGLLLLASLLSLLVLRRRLA